MRSHGNAMAAFGRCVLGKRRPRLPMPASVHGVRHRRLLCTTQAAPATVTAHAAATAPAATQVRPPPAALMGLDRRCERGSPRARLLARSVRPRCAVAGDRRDGADRTGGGEAPRCDAAGGSAASPGVACAAVCAAGDRAARCNVPVAACVGRRRRARQRLRRRAACRGRAPPGGAGPRLTRSRLRCCRVPRVAARGQGAARPACRSK